jgi:glycine/D-amino acid oxidase-like deaminating enzyme
MAAISTRLKGRHLKLRLESLTLYESLIPELIQRTQIEIPYNRHGLLQLVFSETELARGQTAKAVREKQGFHLDILALDQLVERFPELASAYSLETGEKAVGAVYSPQDRQVNPAILTQALIQGAMQNGSQVHLNYPISQFRTQSATDGQHVTHLYTDHDAVPVDWLIVAAGLGTTPLTQTLNQPISIRPVLGQALHILCPDGFCTDSPVINGCDVHLVPVGAAELWVGATVEFPAEKTFDDIASHPQALERLRQQAIALYPAIGQAEVLRTWQGLRPRPCDRAAPVIERLPGYSNVLIAAGHYRNGVLLAPVTAQRIQAFLLEAM